MEERKEINKRKNREENKRREEGSMDYLKGLMKGS